MTIFVLPGGELAIHSGIRLADAEMADIDALGRVAYYLLVPNAHHDPDAAWFAARYRGACFLSPSVAVEQFRQRARVDGTFEANWPAQLHGVLQHHTVAGTRFTETVFLHVPSRTLVVVDLAFNLTRECLERRPLGRFLMKLNNAYDRFGITRLTESLVSDPAALTSSLEEILRWDFDRVVVSHGVNVTSGGKAAFRAGFPRYLTARSA